MKKESLMSYLVLLFAVLVTSLVLGCASDSDNDSDSDSAPQDDHSNTRSGATTLNLNSSRTGEIETGSDVDYFSVTASGPGTLTVYTSGSIDTTGVLEDSIGSQLARDDDRGEDLNFRIVQSVTAGTYYIRVESLGNAATGSYTVHADFTGSSDDHSNTRSGATTLDLNNSLTGNIETGSDVDYFSVTASGPGTLTVYTSGSIDTTGVLEDSSGSQLASNDDSGTGTNFRIVQSVTAGTYYIRVESLGSATGSYTVHADFTASSPASNPDLIVISPSVTDASLTAGQSFTLSATVSNQGTGSAAGTTLTWYRSTNSQISSSDSQVGTDSVSSLSAGRTGSESISLTAPTSAGTYYYGACVASVSGESNTGNNCSTGVSVAVRAATDDHGNSRAAATDFILNNSQTGVIETGSDTDYFKVVATNPGTLTIYTTGSLDSVGTLEDSSGSELARDDDSGAGFNFRIVQSVTAGTYYIKVDGFGSNTGSYTLHADFTTPPPTTSCVSRGLVAGGTISLSRFVASCSSGRVTCGLGSGSCSSECCCLDGGNLQCN